MKDSRAEFGVTVAPPLLHASALERMVSEARENAERAAGPMQHLAVLGPWGSGKSFLVAAMENTLAFDGFRGQVARLPEFAGHIQSPRDFMAEVYSKVEGKYPGERESWEAITAKLDRIFTSRSRKRRLLIVVAENFLELIKRAFPAHADQAKLRNWLDRSESRVMLIATGTTPAIDAEPSDPLFGIFATVHLEPTPLKEAERLLEGYALGGEFRPPDPMFRFLFLLGDRTPRSVEVLAHSYLRMYRQDWRGLIEDYRRFHDRGYEALLLNLGQRAAVCLHAMVGGDEPVTQSGLAAKMGVQQSTIAQPFAEMRRKHLLREEAAPTGRSKLVCVADRFFAAFYREKVLGLPPGADPICLLAEILERPASAVVSDLTKAMVTEAEENGRAAAFKLLSLRRSEIGEDIHAIRALGAELALRITSPDVLDDLASSLALQDHFIGTLLGTVAESRRLGGESTLSPEIRAFVAAKSLSSVSSS